MRKIEDISSGSSGVVMEYNKHQCAGYNIYSTFFNSEKNIVTGICISHLVLNYSGSEDKHIYIYDTFTGKVCKKLKSPKSQVIHLVCPRDKKNSLELVSSSIENLDIYFWGPEVNPKKSSASSQSTSLFKVAKAKLDLDEITNGVGCITLNDTNSGICSNINTSTGSHISDEKDKDMEEEEEEDKEDAAEKRNRIALETLMRRYGDQILQAFHSNNLTFTSVDWEALIMRLAQSSANGSQEGDAEFLRMFTSMSHDIEQALAYCEEGNDPEKLEEYLDSQDPQTSLFASIGRKSRDAGRIGERVLVSSTTTTTTTTNTTSANS